MRNNLYLLLILYASIPGLSFAGDQIHLACLESPTVPAARSVIVNPADNAWRVVTNAPESDRIPRNLSLSEIDDEILRAVQGKAILSPLPSFQVEKNGIILWDEVKINGSKRLNLDNGRNLNFSVRR